jgi:spore coat protein JB
MHTVVREKKRPPGTCGANKLALAEAAGSKRRSLMEPSNALRKMQEVQFALVELQLYLDVNPGDQRAVHQYNCLSKELIALKAEYETKCGPLMQYGFSSSPSRWVWNATPWPWEIEY